ncbi:hypothetical protein BT63DRAFT_415119 [Microthyrium microscopicum]|uniref:Uncharacterized protein n=1 Tax=Microthyrium microscopicum TaxID=703497 RepID=A0A6A6U808_9PEZI|nr:hypothetical protein BT63DRAFT_415119 [Microthyrium microscopicum]
MLFTKTILFAILGLAIAAPVDVATNAVAAAPQDAQDGCNGAYRGEHSACERGRDQKHDGRAEERRGEREIERGQIGKGINNIEKGAHDIGRGQGRECRTGGRC